MDSWLERTARGASSEQLLRALNDGFAALWQRARQTVADVTLAAIGDRVLHTARDRFPVLSGLGITRAGLDSQKLAERAGSINRDQLAQGIRFVLAEFLTVFGHLTADILTPALHLALSKTAPAPGGPEEGESFDQPWNGADDEGKGS